MSKANTDNGAPVFMGVLPGDSRPFGVTPEICQVALSLSSPAAGLKEGAYFPPTGLEATQCMTEQEFLPMSFLSFGFLAALQSQRSTRLEEK